MKPETLQTFARFFVFIGIILTAIGGYGHFHYGKKIEQSREIIIDEKLDNIPLNIRSNSNKNTDSVLKAIENVQLSVDEIASIDGSSFKQINYPKKGGVRNKYN